MCYFLKSNKNKMVHPRQRKKYSIKITPTLKLRLCGVLKICCCDMENRENDKYPKSSSNQFLRYLFKFSDWVSKHDDTITVKCL